MKCWAPRAVLMRCNAKLMQTMMKKWLKNSTRGNSRKRGRYNIMSFLN